MVNKRQADIILIAATIISKKYMKQFNPVPNRLLGGRLGTRRGEQILLPPPPPSLTFDLELVFQ